jgi:hypothetical protein
MTSLCKFLPPPPRDAGKMAFCLQDPSPALRSILHCLHPVIPLS